MVIGRPNVMNLPISAVPRISHSYNIQDPYAVCYITPFCGSYHQSPQDPRVQNYNKTSHEDTTYKTRLTRDVEIGVQTKQFVQIMAWKKLFAVLLLANCVAIALSLPQQSKPKRPILPPKTGGLLLPDNATLIRENIVDTFSCQDRIYGYYADMENECQIFHVCMPQTRTAIRWSFICPAETVFNQATFVCTQTESSIPCEESEKYYALNEEIGKEVEEEEEADQDRGKENVTKVLLVDAETVSKKPFPRNARLINRGRRLQ
ncbi:hypothetical protein HN011_006475 [Eciton burchellii]|nr:hypothetical protein HN011_006475 [Eciton burchellii]